MINKHHMGIIAMLAIIASLAACGSKEKVQDEEEAFVPDPPVWTFNSDSVELGTSDFRTFDIAPDYSKVKESIYKDSKNKSYVENTTFDDVVTITYEGNTAKVENGNADDIKVSNNGAHVTVTAGKPVECVLKGKSQDGSITILGDKKVCLTLNGLDLKNASGPAINSQTKKECFIITKEASVVSDDSLYVASTDSLQQKGCIFGEGKLAFGGTATLKVIAKGTDAIHSDKSVFVRRGTQLDIDSRGGDAIQAQKYVTIEGGMINISSKARGASGIVADSIVAIEGGRTIIISDTPGAKGDKNAKGIKCDSLINITGGIVRVKESSTGGKGIRSGHNILIKNAMVDVLTFGQDDHATGSKNKGVKAMNEVRVDSARVRIRATNGWNEGLEGRRKILINNSLVEVLAHDDGLSSGENGVADVEINSGYVYSESMMDAIDSNGTIHINGGLVFAVSRHRGGRGFDCDANEFRVAPDATIIGLGYIVSYPTASLLEHPACVIDRPLTDTQFGMSTTGKQDNLFTFKTPVFDKYDHGYRILASVPEFAEGVSYDLCSNATVKPAHTFHGLMLGGTVDNKSVARKTTFHKKLNNDNTISNSNANIVREKLGTGRPAGARPQPRSATASPAAQAPAAVSAPASTES